MASIISIIDYGMGNLGSLENMIRKVGGRSELVSAPEAIDGAEKLILPGVGHYDNAVSQIHQRGLWDPIDRKARSGKTPFLCICLGAQLATCGSDEGEQPGFGWIAGKSVRFSFGADSKLRIPHMGWNDVRVVKPNPLMRDLPEDACFYFVHSYYLEAESREDVLAMTKYGIDFASALSKGNITALQFHPEKSHKYGMAVLRNFVEM